MPCSEDQDLTGVATDCKKFLRCVYGTFYELTCPNSQRFDYMRKICDSSPEVLCFGQTDYTTNTTPETTAKISSTTASATTTSTLTTNTRITTTTSSVTKTTTTTATMEKCTVDQDFTGVASDCNKFQRCVSGTFIQMSCALGTKFDYIKKKCDIPSNVTCLGDATITQDTTTRTTSSTVSVTYPSCEQLTCANGFIFDLEKCVCSCAKGFSGNFCEIYDCATKPKPDTSICLMLDCNMPIINQVCPFKCLCNNP